MILCVRSVMLCMAGLACAANATYLLDDLSTPPVEWQARDAEQRLASPTASVRAGAVEQLGFMRAYDRAEAVAAALSDPNASVRREAVMALGWLGNRDSLQPLVNALGDSDWTVRQAAAAALENLTAKKLPFDAFADTELLKKQQKAWADFIAGFDGSELLNDCRKMAAAPSQIHEAEEAVLEGGVVIGSGRNANADQFVDYTANTNATIRWNITRPKSGTKAIALRYSLPAASRPLKLAVNGTVIDPAVDFPATSDWDTWEWVTVPAKLKKGNNTIELSATGSSGGNIDCLMVIDKNKDPRKVFSAESKVIIPEDYFEQADTLRVIGTMHMESAVPLIIDALTPYLTKAYPKDNTGKGARNSDSGRLYTPASPAVDARPERAFVQAGLRALGRLGGKKAEAFLIEMMQTNKDWACYAAEALGDCGGPDAVAALIGMIPKTSFTLDVASSFTVYTGAVEVYPEHDAPKLSAVDRIPRISYEALLALSRLDLRGHKEELRAISPYILSTIPSTFDATIVYMEEPWAMLYGYMLEQAGVRKQAVDAAFTALGVPGRELPDSFELKDVFMQLMNRNLKKKRVVPPALCRSAADAGRCALRCAGPPSTASSRGRMDPD